ncbi:hypothetical protein [Streptomyces sp. enrichment culture]|uniref:hypothetical protein n=1 Tax=Streptomyces sp. enrichment culture TaxID=1795815 RepID=UPI003F547658
MKTSRGVVALLPCCLILSFGCTKASPEREYEIPQSLCGIEIEEEFITPILPPGKNLEVDDRYRRSGENRSPVGTCFINVDGDSAITVDSVPSDDGSGLSSYSDARDHGLSSGELVLTDQDLEIRSWPGFIASHTPCVSSETYGFTGVNVSISLDWIDESDDYSDHLKNLIEPVGNGLITDMGSDTCSIS